MTVVNDKKAARDYSSKDSEVNEPQRKKEKITEQPST